MNFRVYGDQERFLITSSSIEACGLERRKEFRQLYGYLFTETDVIKNCELNEADGRYLESHKSTASGLYCAIITNGDRIQVFMDPMIQYNVFYCIHDGAVSISNSVLLLRAYCGASEINGEYLFDSIAYTSPLRGKTLLRNIYALQYDDLLDRRGGAEYKPKLELTQGNLEIVAPDFEVYHGLEYAELRKVFLDGLRRRAAILSGKFDEVQVQLTGGADSRLALSAFLGASNTSVYVYGDGRSQNRLVFEQLVASLRLRIAKDIPYVGKALSSTALIAKGLTATNFRKLNNLNTYVNADKFVAHNMCKVTGYYGANVSGGVGLPPTDPSRNKRTERFAPLSFSYHDYVSHMRRAHSELSPPAFADIFYLNNRGPAHYAAHSVADNLKCNSFDILYDPVNLFLVRSCPYTDDQINRNAVSIDLIYENNRMLALFPYDSRRIPVYRKFDEVPLINCFDGFTFAEQDLPPLSFIRHEASAREFDVLGQGAQSVSIDDILSNDAFRDFYDKYDSLVAVRQADSLTKMITAYFFLAALVVSRPQV